MSNLGSYQDITIAAKRAGGVDNLKEDIQQEAVNDATPVLLGIGVAAGAVATLAAMAVRKRYQDKRKVSKEAAVEAIRQIKAEVGPGVSHIGDGEVRGGGDAG